jgi:hypothetical protein
MRFGVDRAAPDWNVVTQKVNRTQQQRLVAERLRMAADCTDWIAKGFCIAHEDDTVMILDSSLGIILAPMKACIFQPSVESQGW